MAAVTILQPDGDTPGIIEVNGADITDAVVAWAISETDNGGFLVTLRLVPTSLDVDDSTADAIFGEAR